MSARELTRVEVLSRVEAGTLSLGSAAQLIGVSYRQVKRLARRYRAKGPTGLRHRSAGRPSNHARSAKEHERVLALVREKYSGPIDERFGPTLAAAHLAKEEGITVFFTTHYMEEAERVAQRIAIIDHGRIVADGTALALKKQTKTKSLEDAFIRLTGEAIREEEVTGLDRMRMHHRVWGGQR